MRLLSELKSDEQLRDIRLLGFFSHVQTELQRNAIAAGFDQVIPRSVFARDLENLPQIHGLKIGFISVSSYYPTGAGAITS